MKIETRFTFIIEISLIEMRCLKECLEQPIAPYELTAFQNRRVELLETVNQKISEIERM